jgi:hypothetical protein
MHHRAGFAQYAPRLQNVKTKTLFDILNNSNIQLTILSMTSSYPHERTASLATTPMPPRKAETPVKTIKGP